MYKMNYSHSDLGWLVPYEDSDVLLYKLLVELEDIVDGCCPEEPESGICNIMDTLEFHHMLSDIVHGFMKDWEFYSGEAYYPVPAPKNMDVDALEAYEVSRNLYVGEYGKLRIKLCAYLIERIEEIL